MDLTHRELQVLADHHRFEAQVMNDVLASSPIDEATRKSCTSLLSHHQARGRQIKELLAREESDQTAYEEHGTVIIRKPEWFEEVLRVLETYKEEAEEEFDGKLADGVTALACSTVIGLLEYHYNEEEEDANEADVCNG